jgi:hypothetical protein
MRTARIKVQARDSEAVYHCITRSVNGEHLFDDTAKEVLRQQLWQVSQFCGVQILTYAILSNHLHVLLRVPRWTAPTDAELLRRYAILYPKPTRFQTFTLASVKAQLASDGPEAQKWRSAQLALMGDVSQFMKLVKQRFTIWFNRSHKRFGTLWAERFKSLLLEPERDALETVAAYIDLNSIRAGLATDPKDYRFCGYAEALAGNPAARTALQSIFGGSWSDTQGAYRQTLYGVAADPREHAACLDPEALAEVVAAHGQLPLATILRCRIRYFSDGAALGSRSFVATQLAAYRNRSGRRGRCPRSPNGTAHSPPCAACAAMPSADTARAARRAGSGRAAPTRQTVSATCAPIAAPDTIEAPKRRVSVARAKRHAAAIHLCPRFERPKRA